MVSRFHVLEFTDSAPKQMTIYHWGQNGKIKIQFFRWTRWVFPPEHLVFATLLYQCIGPIQKNKGAVF